MNAVSTGTVMDLYSTIVGSKFSSPAKYGRSVKLSARRNKKDPITSCVIFHRHRSSYFTSFRKAGKNRTNRMKKRKSKKPLPKYELYNLKNDPYETKNLAHGNSKKQFNYPSDQQLEKAALFPRQRRS